MSKRNKLTAYGVERNLENLFPTKGMYVARYSERANGFTDYSRGAHSIMFSLLGISFWFSYDTLIAFQFPGESLVMVENIWGPTTGRHMCEIRKMHSWANIQVVSKEDFVVIYANSCKKAGLRTGPEYQIECEPGTWDRTGFVVPRKEGHPVVPLPAKQFDPPLPMTKAEKARARAIKRKKERKERWAAQAKAKAKREAARAHKREVRKQEIQAKHQKAIRDAANFHFSEQITGMI